MKLFTAALAFPLLIAAQAKSDLAPTGTLRVTFLGNNAMQGRVDPGTGAVSGPVFDITQEIAKRLGVPFKITPGAGVRDVLDSIKNHTSDFALLAYDATRAQEVDFTQPYALSQNSFLVRVDSSLRSVADADRKGVRIVAPKGDSGELYLGRTLKEAELRGIASLTADQAAKMLESKEADAYATNRQRLTETAAQFPSLRVVDGNFFGVEQSLIVAKGNTQGVAFLNRFIDEIRMSGWLQSTITRAKLNGLDVAPARTVR
jgi:polar amino acid transport system substrate-binding protein